MRGELKTALLKCETDLDGALYRFAGNEDLYVDCLRSFLEDTTMAELENAIRLKSWDDAFTAVHALKGVAGNMGFIPLFHASAKTVVHIRAGRMKEIEPSYCELKNSYSNIIGIIKKYL